MKITIDGRFLGGAALLFAMTGIAYALHYFTGISGVTSMCILLGILALVPIGMLGSRKFYVKDKRLAFISLCLCASAVAFSLLLLLAHHIVCDGSTMYYCGT